MIENRPESPGERGRSRKRRQRIVRGSLVLAASAVALVAYGTVKAQRIERDARLFAETGKGVLTLLAEHAASLQAGDLERALACYTDDFESPDEGDWVETFRQRRDGVAVYEWQLDAPRAFDRDALRDQLASFLTGAGELDQVKLKLAALEDTPGDGTAVVRAVLWLRGTREADRSEAAHNEARTSEGGNHEDRLAFESQANLRLWLEKDLGGWRITRRQLLDGETVTGRRQGFVDVASAAGLDFESRINPDFSTPEWRPERFAILQYGSAGVSAVDYDGDGWDDLFFGDGAHPRLFRNRGDGTFEETTAMAGLPSTFGSANEGLFADLDNDGDKDLVLTGFTQPSGLYENLGDGTFVDRTADAGLGEGFVTVASAADYDGDGLLDLYLGRYLDPRINLPVTLFYTRNGEGNSLLANRGDLTFEDVTETAGVRDGGLTLGAAWGDVDADGDLDLYVANDFGRNALFANQGDGTFADVSFEAGALDIAFGMSASFGDVDADGDLDIYVSNVHSGQRWYGQAPSLTNYLLTSVRQGTLFEDFPAYRDIYRYTGADWKRFGDQMVKGNSLLLNDGQGRFRDVAEAAGVNPYGWYWGSGFLDYDNDGRQDIYAANGWISGKRYDDL